MLDPLLRWRLKNESEFGRLHRLPYPFVKLVREVYFHGDRNRQVV